MKRRKKIVAAALIMAIGICETGPAVCRAEASDSDTDPFGRYEETVEITSVKNLGAGIEFPEGESLDDNVWTRLYEEELNIKVNWLWSTSSDQYDQKVNIAITSNDIPDVMCVSATQLKLMYDNEQIMDIMDIAADYLADYTKEVLESDGGTGLASATFDDRLYAIPAIGAGLLSGEVLWVRTDWLENLGLELPETVDDMLAIAEAFSTQDPDGNGVDDTYGLAVTKDLYGTGFADLLGFFNAYNAYPTIWVNNDGTLEYGGISDEVKTALGVLNEMYENGYIDPEFGVKDSSKVCEDVAAGKIGMMFGNYWNMAWINDAKVADPTYEWVPVAIPSLDGETAGKASLPMGTSSYYVISKDCENPEAVIRLLNLQLEKNYGESAEPDIYNITPEGYGPYQYTVIAVEPPMKNITAALKVTAVMNGEADEDTLNAEEDGYYQMCLEALAGNYGNNNWHQLKMWGPGGALGVMNTYWEEGNYVEEAYYAAPTETMTEKQSTLDKQMLQDYTTIILEGDLDLFDEFVANWYKLGGETITEEVNAWYAEQ